MTSRSPTGGNWQQRHQQFTLINQSINQSIVWLIEILLTNLFRATVNWTVHFPFKHCLSVQHLIVLMAERKSVWLNRIHCYPGIHMKVNAWRQLVLNWTNALAGLIRCNAGVITGIRSVCGRPTPFCTIWSIEIANCCPDRSLFDWIDWVLIDWMYVHSPANLWHWLIN